jgi:HPt (histidine-containing phosphotransfer) domain-containing protein
MNATLETIKNYLRTEFEMDDEEIQEMLELFVDSMTELSETANNQAENSNIAGLKETGHSIKGAAANVGALVISEVGKEMETAGKAGDISKCAEHAAKFAELVAELS